MANRRKTQSRFDLKRALRIALRLGALAMGLAVLTVVVVAVIIVKDLPSIDSLADYAPPQVTRIYSDDGHVVGEIYRERRTVASMENIPEHVKHAFIAAEDAKFFEHEGLDYLGIARAAIKNLRPGARLQGASTITQQIVKTMVVGAERSYTRKMREALLTKELEDVLSKDDILHLYLNQIYFGSGAYGVEEAARRYFGKSVSDITVAEAAYLAAAPKNPNFYNIRARPRKTKERQSYVLKQMIDNGWVDEAQGQQAIDAPIPAPHPDPPYLGKAPHYVEHVRRILMERYDEDLLYEGGLTVYTGMNAKQQDVAHRMLRRGLQDIGRKHGYPGAPLRVEVDRYDDYYRTLHKTFDEEVEKRKIWDDPKKRWIWDLTWVGPRSLADRGLLRNAIKLVPFEEDRRVVGLVERVDPVAKDTFVDLGSMVARIRLKSLDWARRFSPLSKTPPPRSPTEVFRKGDLVTIDITGKPAGAFDGRPMVTAELVPHPRVEGAMVAIDPHTRHVTALVGGYDHTGSAELIRAVQAKRQPGSSFKPILYTAAIGQKAISAASICPDSPVVIRDPWTGEAWKPENYDGEYDGNITYRQALTRSKNTCSVKLLDKIGVDPVLDEAKALGIESPLPRAQSLALGTGEMAPIELANAYATIASGGNRAEPIFIRKVVSRQGDVLEETRAFPEPALDPAAAFVVTQMMRSVVEEGTAQRAMVLERMVVGKTGTTQKSRDVWFSGFAPELVATVWVGFDNNQPMGRVYGSSGALPIWLNFMGVALAGTPMRDFPQPEGIVTMRVDRKTGQATSSTSDSDSLLEYFIEGTEPEPQEERILNPFLINEDAPDEAPAEARKL